MSTSSRTGSSGNHRKFASRLRRGPVNDWGQTLFGVVILCFLLFPVYWMVNVSLQAGGGAASTPWFPSNVTWNGYAQAVRDQGSHLLTSLVVASGSVVVSLLIATPAAYALAIFRVRGANAVLLGILISQMIPSIVVANALYSAYTELGLLNSVLGLILADSTAGIPFAILILNAFMRSMPMSVIEAARIDGAGQLRTLVSVVLPMSRNSIVTAALFTFLFSWSDFLFALTLTTTDEVRPVTLGLYMYISGFISDWSSVMATSVLASIPTIILLVFAQRYIAAGTTAGAVK